MLGPVEGQFEVFLAADIVFVAVRQGAQLALVHFQFAFFVDFKEKQFRVLAEPPVVAVALQNTFSLGAETVVADLVVRAIGGEGIGVGVDKAGTAGKQQSAARALMLVKDNAVLRKFLFIEYRL